MTPPCGRRHVRRTSTVPTAPTPAPDDPTAHAPDSDAGHHQQAGTHTADDHPKTGPAHEPETASPPTPAAALAPPHAAPAHPATPSTPHAQHCPASPDHRPPAATPQRQTR